MRWHKVWQKNVSIDLIEAAPRLLPRSHPKVSAWVAERLKSLGINVMVGQSVQAETYNKLMVSGHAIATRTVIWTAGVANHPFFTNNQPLFRLDDHGKVMVYRFLRARSHIYVLGDNANTPYSGMAQTALHDARLVSRNLIRAGRRQSRMAYRPSRPISIIPVGSKWAILEWGPIHFRGRLIARLRRTADLIAYLDIEPLQRAARIWLSDNQPEEDCPICDQLANEAAAAK